MPTQMHLNLFNTVGGYHQAGWRLADTRPDRFFQLEHHVAIARACEAAKLDSMFIADTQFPGMLRSCPFDALTLAAALAAKTDHIGLIATVSTTLNDPFAVARRFSTLDQLSSGRAAWNIVTSFNPDEMAAYGIEGLPSHKERYARGEEFVGIVKQLWDSWEDDALTLNKDTGVFYDPSRVHPIDHVGDHYRVKGANTQPPSPQRWPVLVQAGSSSDGIAFAARHAEVVFTVQPTLESAREFRSTLRAEAENAGRDPDSIAVLPGLFAVSASTTQDAEDRVSELSSKVNFDVALDQLGAILGPHFNLREHPLDQPLPVDVVDASEAQQARSAVYIEMARQGNLTLRQLANRTTLGQGHHVVVGSFEQVADEMQLWFESGACDGFNVQPPSVPRDLDLFLGEVVPILKDRGIFRTDYEGPTLRDHFRLARPAAVS